jgi:hypothetical protein
MNNRKVFVTVLQTRSLRLGCQHCGVLVKTLYWVADGFFALSSHGEETKKASFLVSSSKGTNIIISAPHSKPNYFTNVPPPKISHCELGLQHTNIRSNI